MALLICHTGTQGNLTHRWPSRRAEGDPYLSLNELTYLWGLCVFWESHLSWGRLRTPFKENLIYLEKSVCAPSTIFLCTIPWTGWWNRQFQAKALFRDTCLQITGHEIQVSRMPGKRDYDASTVIGWGRDECLHTCVRQILPSSRNKERLSDQKKKKKGAIFLLDSPCLPQYGLWILCQRDGKDNFHSIKWVRENVRREINTNIDRQYACFREIDIDIVGNRLVLECRCNKINLKCRSYC